MAPPPTSGPSPELRARLLEAVRREPAKPLRSGQWRAALLVLLAFAAMAGTALLLGAWGHAPERRPHGYVMANALAWLIVAIAVTWAGFGRGRSMLGRSAGWREAVVTLTPLVMVALWLPVALAWPSTLDDPPVLRSHMACFTRTLLFALGPLVALALLRRSSDPVRPGLTAAAIGAVGGAWAAVAMSTICGFTAPVHMILGHVLPVAAATALCAVVLRRVVDVRARKG